jgi:hypothetical protein
MGERGGFRAAAGMGEPPPAAGTGAGCPVGFCCAGGAPLGPLGRGVPGSLAPGGGGGAPGSFVRGGSLGGGGPMDPSLYTQEAY